MAHAYHRVMTNRKQAEVRTANGDTARSSGRSSNRMRGIVLLEWRVEETRRCREHDAVAVYITMTNRRPVYSTNKRVVMSGRGDHAV